MFIYSVLSEIVLRLWVRNCNIANVNRLMVVAYMVQLNVRYCYVHQCNPSHTISLFLECNDQPARHPTQLQTNFIP